MLEFEGVFEVGLGKAGLDGRSIISETGIYKNYGRGLKCRLPQLSDGIHPLTYPIPFPATIFGHFLLRLKQICYWSLT